MKVEAFLDKFGQFAGAPGATAKIRELLLEWAVKGRLVPQNAKDEKAQALLKRVTIAAKVRGRGPGSLADAEIPFRIPGTWEWVRLPRVLKKLTDGTHHSPPNGPSGAFMYVTAKNIKTDGIVFDGITYVGKKVHEAIYSRCDPSFGDILYIKDGATTGIATINQIKEPFSMLSSVALLKPSEAIYNRYLLWVLRSPFYFAETRGAMKGAAITRVTLSRMAASLVPLPPLAEQKRIVAKVDELMALCDRLEAQQQERETRHTALARASLARFADAPTPANLGFLFHKSYDISPEDLRKAILSLAIRGKLVSQDPKDESILALLDHVSAHKTTLAKAGRLRGQVSVTPMGDDEGEFELPPTWAWVRFGQIMINRDSERIPVSKAEREGRPKIFDYYGASGVIDKIDAYLFDKPLLLIGEDGANLVNRSTPIAFVARGKYWVNNHAHVLDGFSEDLLRYIALHINAISLEKYITGSAQPKMNQAKMNSIPIALPPLAEQRRIVAKVDQLMALVDELEQQLTESRATGAKLLEAVVAEIAA